MLYLDLVGLLAVLGVLWFLDELLTALDVKKFGLRAEANPIMKHFLKEGGEAPLHWKIFSFAVFCGIAGLLYYLHKEFAWVFLGIVIVIYAIVVIHNLEIYEETKSN